MYTKRSSVAECACALLMAAVPVSAGAVPMWPAAQGAAGAPRVSGWQGGDPICVWIGNGRLIYSARRGDSTVLRLREGSPPIDLDLPGLTNAMRAGGRIGAQPAASPDARWLLWADVSCRRAFVTSIRGGPVFTCPLHGLCRVVWTGTSGSWTEFDWSWPMAAGIRKAYLHIRPSDEAAALIHVTAPEGRYMWAFPGSGPAVTTLFADTLGLLRTGFYLYRSPSQGFEPLVLRAPPPTSARRLAHYRALRAARAARPDSTHLYPPWVSTTGVRFVHVASWSVPISGAARPTAWAARIPGKATPVRIRYAPDHKRMIWVSGRSVPAWPMGYSRWQARPLAARPRITFVLWLTDVRGNRPIRLCTLRTRHYDRLVHTLSWSPDGSQIAYVQGGRVRVIRVPRGA